MSNIVAIIPARYGSTRLPGKALLEIGTKPLIQHVYEHTARADTVSRVVVATDDERILRAVTGFGGEAIMTSPFHRSGTDRVSEAAGITGGSIIVNVQGDEPLIDPHVIDAVCERIMTDDGIVCSTAASPITDSAEYDNPNAVKVVVDLQGRALYFSRSPLPYYRDSEFAGAYLHTGIYCFRRSFLLHYTSLEQTPLEQAEKLEQLRMLEHGYRIGVVLTEYHSFGIDTKDDLEMLRRMIG